MDIEKVWRTVGFEEELVTLGLVDQRLKDMDKKPCHHEPRISECPGNGCREGENEISIAESESPRALKSCMRREKVGLEVSGQDLAGFEF